MTMKVGTRNGYAGGLLLLVDVDMLGVISRLWRWMMGLIRIGMISVPTTTFSRTLGLKCRFAGLLLYDASKAWDYSVLLCVCGSEVDIREMGI